MYIQHEFQFLGYKRKYFIAGTQIQNLKNYLKRVVPPIPFYVDNWIFGNMQYIPTLQHTQYVVHILTKRKKELLNLSAFYPISTIYEVITSSQALRYKMFQIRPNCRPALPSPSQPAGSAEQFKIKRGKTNLCGWHNQPSPPF